MTVPLPLLERVAVASQYLLPKQALTAFAGFVAGWQGGSATTALIRWFIGRYGVNMAERLAKRFGASLGAGAVKALRELTPLR